MIPALVFLTALGATDVLGELHQIDRALVEAEDRLHLLEQQSEDLKQQLADLDVELAATEVERRRAFADFRKRLRALAHLPSGARWAMLGGSRSLEEYLETTRLLRVVAKHDLELQRAYVEQQDRYAELQATLDRRRDQLETLAAETRNHRDRVAAERRNRVALLESVARQPDLKSVTASQKKRARAALATMVKKLQPRGAMRKRFADNAGRLPWPSEGRVTIGFGQQRETAFGTVTSHNGLDIAAPAGAEVRAVFSGTVAYADWLEGYGQLVILDHGDGYHTLMAHLASVRVVVGVDVTQGTIIGTVGDTGSLRGTVLYFELRHDAATVDPTRWLRK